MNMSRGMFFFTSVVNQSGFYSFQVSLAVFGYPLNNFVPETRVGIPSRTGDRQESNLALVVFVSRKALALERTFLLV